jgi:hypothetical protein
MVLPFTAEIDHTCHSVLHTAVASCRHHLRVARYAKHNRKCTSYLCPQLQDHHQHRTSLAITISPAHIIVNKIKSYHASFRNRLDHEASSRHDYRNFLQPPLLLPLHRRLILRRTALHGRSPWPHRSGRGGKRPSHVNQRNHQLQSRNRSYYQNAVAWVPLFSPNAAD